MSARAKETKKLFDDARAHLETMRDGGMTGVEVKLALAGLQRLTGQVSVRRTFLGATHLDFPDGTRVYANVFGPMPTDLANGVLR